MADDQYELGGLNTTLYKVKRTQDDLRRAKMTQHIYMYFGTSDKVVYLLVVPPQQSSLCSLLPHYNLVQEGTVQSLRTNQTILQPVLYWCPKTGVPQWKCQSLPGPDHLVPCSFHLLYAMQLVPRPETLGGSANNNNPIPNVWASMQHTWAKQGVVHKCW